MGLLAAIGFAGGAAGFGMWGGGGGPAVDLGNGGASEAEAVVASGPDAIAQTPVLAARGRAAAGDATSPSLSGGPGETSIDAAPPAKAASSSPRVASMKADDLGQRLWRTILAQQADDGRLPADPALRPCARGEVAWCLRAPLEPAPVGGPPDPQDALPPFDPRDVLRTAYGIEALHAEGYTYRSDGAEGRFVRKAVRWLKGRQDAQGGFGTADATTSALADARATAVLVEVYDSTRSEWILPTTTSALGALGRRFDRSRSDAIAEDDSEFPEAALAAARACGTAALVAASLRQQGKRVTVSPPLGLVRTLSEWASGPVVEGSPAELHRAMARVCLGADPMTDPSLLRVVARLRNEGGEPYLPADPLERLAAATVMGTARYEDWRVWAPPFWSTYEADFPASKNPCESATKDGIVPELSALALRTMAREAFGWNQWGRRSAPVDAMEEARLALELDIRTGSR